MTTRAGPSSRRPWPLIVGALVAASALRSTHDALGLIARLPRDQAEAVLLRAVMGLDAKTAAKVAIYQRSANWIMPRKDRLYAPRTQRLLTRFPALAKLYHKTQWFVFGEMQLTPLMKQVRPVQALISL